MTNSPRDEEDDLHGAEVPAKEWRSAQNDRDRDHAVNLGIKVRLVGALWGICLLAPTLLFPAGWIRWTWIVIAVLVTCAVVIRVYRQGRQR